MDPIAPLKTTGSSLWAIVKAHPIASGVILLGVVALVGATATSLPHKFKVPTAPALVK